MRRADHVVVDGPPRIAALARSALLAADQVLVPVQPSPYDVWASAEMVSLIREARVFRPALRAAFVIIRRVVRTVIHQSFMSRFTGCACATAGTSLSCDAMAETV